MAADLKPDTAKVLAEPLSASSGSTTDQSVMTISVVYAEPSRIWQKTLQLPTGATAAQAFVASRFSEEHPDYPISTLAFGVFGQICVPGYCLGDADRLEIYRALNFDPMESRRRRAAHRKTSMIKPANRPRRSKKDE